jgi:hypothetical protein
MVAYLLWKTDRTVLDLNGLAPGLEGRRSLAPGTSRDSVADFIVDYGNKHLNSAERLELTRRLATQLGHNYDTILEKRLFHLVTPDELRRLATEGVDVQLHTHRHDFDITDRREAEREIRENRESLAPLISQPLVHFCYPSGIFHPRVWPWLEDMGLRSATTTEAGFCRVNTPRYALPRIVDGEILPDIEFEAEMAGVLELYRRAQGWLGLTPSRDHRGEAA